MGLFRKLSSVSMRNITITGAAVLALAGCGGTAAHLATHHATAVSCRTQGNAWKATGGTADTDVKAIITDLHHVSAAGQDLGALQAAATQLGTDAQAMLADLPPACVPGMRTDMATSMNDFIAASASINQGTTTDLANADVQIKAGSAAFTRATNDMSKWAENTP